MLSILSAAALIKTLTGWKRARLASDRSPVYSRQNEFDLAFANTVLFALLVSYHLNPHDLSLLLLPMVVLLRDAMTTAQPPTNFPRWLILALSALLFLPPLNLLGLQAHAYAVVSIPLIALFAVNSTFAGLGHTMLAKR